MKKFIVVPAALFFFSCNNPVKYLHENIDNADSVAINYFKGDGTMDTVVTVKIIRDKKSIEQLTGMITGTNASVKNDCGYDGSLHFFKKNRVVQDIFFNSNKEECSQFVFVAAGKKQATDLPAEAKAFLSAIKNK